MGKKGRKIIKYISPFENEKTIRDYDGSVMSDESTLRYNKETLIYFIRIPFSNDGNGNGKRHADVQGFILEGPNLNEDGKREYALKTLLKDEKIKINRLIRDKKGKDISSKFRH